MGHNNNRWRGIHRWHDGSEWILQAHHMTELTVAEHAPIRKGQQFAWGAGVLSGAVNHTHFGETEDASAAHPEVVERLTALAETARADLGDWGREGAAQRAAGWVDDPRPQLLSSAVAVVRVVSPGPEMGEGSGCEPWVHVMARPRG